LIDLSQSPDIPLINLKTFLFLFRMIENKLYFCFHIIYRSASLFIFNVGTVIIRSKDLLKYKYILK